MMAGETLNSLSRYCEGILAGIEADDTVNHHPFTQGYIAALKDVLSIIKVGDCLGQELLKMQRELGQNIHKN